MKDIINKLSEGIVDYDVPILEASVYSIDLSIEAGSVFDGEFEIASLNNIEMKGIIYSTHESFVIVNNNFVSAREVIHYKINASNCNESDHIKGLINIVSNGGEYSIKYNIKIEANSLKTSEGRMKNLFHFANFVQLNYEEAIKVFFSEEFKKVFLLKDYKLSAVYDGLIKTTDKQRALEEFLIYVNKKNNTSISLDSYEKNIDIKEERIERNEFYRVTISKNNWGYVDIDINTKGDFIIPFVNNVKAKNFEDNNYDFLYSIDLKKLNAGNNYAQIIFKTYDNEIIYNVLVKNSGNKSDELKEHRFEAKECMYKLMNLYIKFRLRMYDLESWVNESLALIKRIEQLNFSTTFLKLFKAQIYITKRMEKEAIIILDEVEEYLLPNKKKEIELYSYFLYVKSIEKRDYLYTEEISNEIKSYYYKGYDSYKILWIMLYLDKDFEGNEGLKLIKIKEQFKLGCSSPLMYYEALNIYNQNPEFLTQIDQFETQILYFGYKYKGISEVLSRQIVEISMYKKTFNKRLYLILEDIYNKYKWNEAVTSICATLIKGSKTGKEYIKWYELGINKELKITGIYEYFINSIDYYYDEELPKILLMYFIYNINSIKDKQAFLYANIIKYKDKHPNIYNSYIKHMERYTIDQVIKGNVDIYLKKLYEEFLKKSLVTPEIAKKLPKIINTYYLLCNSSNIKEVVVIHKEKEGEVIVPLVKGKAYVQLYTEEAVILFKDNKGNRYIKNIDYKLEKLLNMDDYTNLCFDVCFDNKDILLYFAERFSKYRNYPEKTINLLKNISFDNDVRESYKKGIIEDVIDYYNDNYDSQSLDSYIKEIDKSNLDTNTRVKIVEIMIDRGLYEQAYEMFLSYGYEYVNPRKMVKFCTKLTQKIEQEYDETLLNICIYSFRKGKYNEDILEYLGRYYCGTTKEMLALWEANKDFEFENRQLEERLIRQIIFTRTYQSNLFEVFESYYKKGASRLIKRGFIVYKMFEYFIKDKVVDEKIFFYLEEELDYYNDYPDVAKLAFVKHFSDKQNLTKRQKDIIKKSISQLCKKNIVFEFYKTYKKYFKLPNAILDKTVVEYRTNPKSKVKIHYLVETGMYEEKGYLVEDMKMVFPGIFVKEFEMFYGESIAYYIAEEIKGIESLTESDKIIVDENIAISDESRYGLINDMMICKEMREDKTLIELVEKYIVNEKLSYDLFTID